MDKRKIILASSSPRRRNLLKQAGLKFRAVNTRIEEDYLIKKFKKKGLKNLVKILSLAKAKSIVGACHGKPLDSGVPLQGNEIIVGFDTIVAYKNKIITKPKNKKDALKKLLFLSNKQHRVLTGIAIIDLKKKRIITDYEMTKVQMKKITRKEAANYINTKEPFDKAGGYAIQGKGRKFVKGICRDYFNVVGLPLKKFLLRLKQLI